MKGILTLSVLMLIAMTGLAQEEAVPAAKARDVTIVEMEPMTMLYVREKAADFEPEDGYPEGPEGVSMAYEAMIAAGFAALGEWLEIHKVTPTGAAFAIYDNNPQDTATKDLTCRTCCPVGSDCQGDEDATVETLPKMTVASLTFMGPFEENADAWGVITAWIPANGYQFAGMPMEIYHVPPPKAATPSDIHTEIRWPVMKAEEAKPEE